jgi:Ser-tRNA(Ala) deacylase AlaX
MTTELLFRNDAYLKTARAQVAAVHERGIELDRTIFYPMGGGQMGDSGVLLRANGERVAIVDTRKGDGIDGVLHVADPPMPQLQVGETLTLEIDWLRRYALMRLHTALHVMSCVVVAPVTGGNIASDKARLDFDIDGTGNAVMESNVKRPARARRNEQAANAAPIEVAHTVLSRAVEAKRQLNHDTARTWTIYNPSARSGTGRPAGYTLMPLHNTSTVFPAWREAETVGFAFHHFWVTPYRDGQLYAAGPYPNQAKSTYTDTLYSYADNSSIYDRDVVVWYSMGDTHVPRPEDFPLMSSKKLSVVFHPDGFFQRNAVFGPQDVDTRVSPGSQR